MKPHYAATAVPRGALREYPHAVDGTTAVSRGFRRSGQYSKFVREKFGAYESTDAGKNKKKRKSKNRKPNRIASATRRRTDLR